MHAEPRLMSNEYAGDVLAHVPLDETLALEGEKHGIRGFPGGVRG